MSSLENDGRFAPCLVASCLLPRRCVVFCHVFSLRLIMPCRGRAPRSSAGCVVQSLPLVCLPFFRPVRRRPGWAQTLAQAGTKPDNLPPVVVTTSQRKPIRRVNSAIQRSQSRARVAGPARSRATAPVSASAAGAGKGAQTPLNSNAIAASASRLGLTVREIPATVEVIDQQTIRDQGYRTVTRSGPGCGWRDVRR